MTDFYSDSDSDPDLIDLSAINFKEDETLDLIDPDEFQDKLNTYGDKVYQIQGIHDSPCAFLMEIGVSVENTHLLIKEYDLNNYYKCQLLSYVYRESDLINLQKNSKIPMIRLRICHKIKQNKTHSIAGNEAMSIIFSFNTFEHLQNNKQLLEYGSNKNCKIPIRGFFQIGFSIGKTYQVYENMKNYVGHNEMIKKLGEVVVQTQVKKILFKHRIKN
jgi:hypothetical protein